MPNVGGPELLLILAVYAPFATIPSPITWRRGGSRARIVATFLIALIPYLGWVVAFVLAFMTQPRLRAPESAAIRSRPDRQETIESASGALFCGKCARRGRRAATHFVGSAGRLFKPRKGRSRHSRGRPPSRAS